MCGLAYLFERDQWHTVNVYELTNRVRENLITHEQVQRAENATNMSRLTLHNQVVDLRKINKTSRYVSDLSR